LVLLKNVESSNDLKKIILELLFFGFIRKNRKKYKENYVSNE
tara:strand:- start:160 stop:285 length:126 start_codon:yes stop_codon:yes gene_type:complete